MSNISLLSRVSIVTLALVGAACGDMSPVAPTAPGAPASTLEVGVTDSAATDSTLSLVPDSVFADTASMTTMDFECTTNTENGESSCAPVTSVAGGVSFDVIFSGTNYFSIVKASSSCVDNGNVGRTCTESTAIKNLMSQPIGVTTSGTIQGVKAIFKSMSAAKTNGTAAAISLGGASTGSFTGVTCTNNGSTVACPYVTFAQQVAPQATSSSQTWVFTIKAPATTYSYTLSISVPTPVESAVFRWVRDQQDLTSAEAFYGVHGRSATEAYAVGSSGMISKWNGTAWSAMTSGTTVRLNSVWANTSTSDVFAAGFTNTMLRWNGTAWTKMTIPADPTGKATTWYGVYGFSASDVFAVGGNGLIRRWNGTAWSAMTSPVASLKVLPVLTAVWGTSNSNVFAVGTNGTILKFNGTTWTTLSSGTTTNLYSIWGNATGTVIYASGRSGVLLRSTNGGTTWTPVALPTAYATQYMWGMWGTSGATTSLYIATQGGTVLHFDGTTWRTQDTNQTSNLYGMWGTSATNIVLGGSGKTLMRGTN